MAKRKSRWWTKVIGVIVALALLVGAAEVALRLIIPGVIANELRSQLHLTEDHPVEVSLGGSALLHAIGGGIGDVTVDVPNAPIIEGVTADAVVRAERVPFDPTQGKMTGATARLQVNKEKLGDIVALVTQGIAQRGSVRGDNLVVGRDLEVFGQSVSLSATLHPEIVDGAVKIEPVAVSAAGLDLTAEQISEATGSLLDPIVQPQVVCVADRLPVGITLTGIELSSTGSVAIVADLSPTILSDPKQLELGTCE